MTSREVVPKPPFLPSAAVTVAHATANIIAPVRSPRHQPRFVSHKTAQKEADKLRWCTGGADQNELAQCRDFVTAQGNKNFKRLTKTSLDPAGNAVKMKLIKVNISVAPSTPQLAEVAKVNIVSRWGRRRGGKMSASHIAKKAGEGKAVEPQGTAGRAS